MKKQLKKGFVLFSFFIVFLFLFVKPVLAVDQFIFAASSTDGYVETYSSTSYQPTLITNKSSFKIRIEFNDTTSSNLKVEKLSNYAGWSGIESIGPGGKQWTLSGVAPGTYYFKAQVGQSCPPSVCADAVATLNVIVKPVMTAVHSCSPSKVTLNWTAVPGTGVYYNVWRSDMGLDLSDRPIAQPSTNSFIDDGIGSPFNPNTPYTYLIRALQNGAYIPNMNASASVTTGSCVSCGNSIVEAGEQCDDGAQNGVCPATCSLSCTPNNCGAPEYCGDGIVQTPNDDGQNEQCDDGNTNTNDVCTYPACQNARCGDAIIRTGVEQCDDGNTVSTDACTNSCNNARCGDGFVQPSNGEQCDDSNTNSGDGCSNTCQVEPKCVFTSASWSTSTTVEGNVVSLNVQGTNCAEQSVSFVIWEDDTTSGDDPVQTNPVSVAFSGNTATGSWAAEWRDDGFGGGDPEYYFIAQSTIDSSVNAQSGLLTVSQAIGPVCGDGSVNQVSEQCDDGNTVSTDACTYPLCKNAVCGDSIVRTDVEQCDDGNTANNDGCSSTCQNEPKCVFTSAAWSTTQATEGQTVGLNVQGNNCGGQTVSFVIWEDDTTSGDDPVNINPSNVVFVSNGVVRSWTAEWQSDGLGNDPEYYFIAQSTTNSSINAQSGLLTVSRAIGPFCGDGSVNQASEQCDDGNTVNTDACTNSCNNARCGDGIVRTNVEQCDDSNTANNDGCSSICQIESAPSCQFTSAVWSTTTTTEGNVVSLNVQGNNCGGQAVSFVVWEDDTTGDDPVQTNPVSVSFSGNTATGTWVAEWQSDGFGNDPEYYFDAQLTTDANIKARSNLLTVTQVPPPPPSCGNNVVDEASEQCDGGIGCSDCSCSVGYDPTSPISVNCQAEPPPQCQLTSAAWSRTQATEGQTVNLNVQGNNCDAQSVSFVVWEDDTTSTDDAVNVNPVSVAFSGNTATGNWAAEWQDDGILGNDPEYYFLASVSGAGNSPLSSGTLDNQLLHVNQSTVIFQCSDIATCGNYIDSGSCNDDVCNVAENSVPSGVDCDYPNVDCSCAWNTTTNNCDANVSGPVGMCVYTQQTTDDCSDGFLTFSWTTRWTWFSGKTAADDPEGLHLRCVSGSRIAECPAQIALPFFSFYNLIVAVIVIGLIYWVLAMKKFGRRKNSRFKQGNKFK